MDRVHRARSFQGERRDVMKGHFTSHHSSSMSTGFDFQLATYQPSPVFHGSQAHTGTRGCCSDWHATAVIFHCQPNVFIVSPKKDGDMLGLAMLQGVAQRLLSDAVNVHGNVGLLEDDTIITRETNRHSVYLSGEECKFLKSGHQASRVFEHGKDPARDVPRFAHCIVNESFDFL